VHKQHLTRAARELEHLHGPTSPSILDALPLEERLGVWELVKADRDGEILLEVSDAVRGVAHRGDDSRELSPLPRRWKPIRSPTSPGPAKGVIEEVVQSLPAQERERLRAALVLSRRLGGRADGLRPRQRAET